MNEDGVTDCLTALIDTCAAAENGFRSCAGNAERMALQLMMTQRAGTWHRWAEELRALRDNSARACVSQPGRLPANASLAGASDMALLAQCERAEAIALQRYRDTLEQEVPRVVRAVLQRHVDAIQRSRAHMRSLRVGAVLTPA